MAQLRDEFQKKSEELANVQQVLRETEQEETNLREQVAEMKKELDLKVLKPIPGIMLFYHHQIKLFHTCYFITTYIIFLQNAALANSTSSNEALKQMQQKLTHEKEEQETKIHSLSVKVRLINLAE